MLPTRCACLMETSCGGRALRLQDALMVDRRECCPPGCFELASCRRGVECFASDRLCRPKLRPIRPAGAVVMRLLVGPNVAKKSDFTLSRTAHVPEHKRTAGKEQAGNANRHATMLCTRSARRWCISHIEKTRFHSTEVAWAAPGWGWVLQIKFLATLDQSDGTISLPFTILRVGGPRYGPLVQGLQK